MTPLRSFYTLGVLILLLLATTISCNNSQSEQTQAEHRAEVNTWHQNRIQSLKENDSWLTLAGLYELQEGSQTLGSASTNDLVFPPEAAGQISTIKKNDSSFSITIKKGVRVLHDSSAISEMELKTSLSGEATQLRHKSLIWYIIERRGTFYIRLKDTDHPNLISFNGIERFPVSRKWRVQASFNPFDKPKTITIPDILGDSYERSIYGTLEFTHQGKKYSIAPLGHPKNDEEFFIIIGDQTNGESTYSGGRYLYAPTPNKDGTTYMDFNKLYNPPCVFTNFATCPLPPVQNRLDLAIPAGEKMYNH